MKTYKEPLKVNTLTKSVHKQLFGPIQHTYHDIFNESQNIPEDDTVHMLDVDENASNVECMGYQLTCETDDVLIESVIEDDDLPLAEGSVISEAISHTQTLLPNVKFCAYGRTR